MNRIEKKFLEERKAILRHNLILLTKSAAIDFIDACEKELVIIVGIDSFFLKDNSIQPSLENSIDFTLIGSEIKGDIYKIATEFLSKRRHDLVFEIVCKNK